LRLQRPSAALENETLAGVSLGFGEHSGGPMARKPQVAVEPRDGGRWAVQTDGTQRADSLHDRKSAAVARARELAGNKKTELVIKDERGRITGKDSHGNDPRRTRG
jgi:hypothetical protein